MNKVICKNKFAKFNFQLLKIYTGGLVLTGPEVKSIRANNVNIKNCYLTIKNNEVWIINMFVANYMKIEADEQRSRKVLLNKNEILRIKMEVESKKLTLVATTLLFNKRSKVKIEFALAKGKNLSDKRETIKKRDNERLIKKKLKNNLV